MLKTSHNIRQPQKTPLPSDVRFANATMSPSALARYIDHTKLTYQPGENQAAAIRALCDEARQNGFYAVCVRPNKIEQAKRHLNGSGVQVATVIGFPRDKVKLADERQKPTIGNVPLSRKKQEAIQAVQRGADELDLVMNVGKFLKEAHQSAQPKTLEEFRAIKAIAGPRPVKVIIETDLLTPEHIQKATQVCVLAGVDMVKTSTGMVDGGVGATVENVALIRRTLEAAGMSGKIGIKASGGVRTPDKALALIEAGATRLGTSSGVALVQGLAGQAAY